MKLLNVQVAELFIDNIKNILHYCMNSGGLLKPLELTPLQIELILKKTAKTSGFFCKSILQIKKSIIFSQYAGSKN